MDPNGWVRVLGRLIDLDPAIVIPGHGIQGTVDALKGQRAYLSAILEAVHTGIANKQTPDQIFTTIDFNKYKPWSDNDTRNHNAVNAMYEKLKLVRGGEHE
jgi:glyoxylase-like metal-dependent hydrolase (beta-lactamase superfamily II)